MQKIHFKFFHSMTITLIILIITVAMFIWGRVRADIVALSALAAHDTQLAISWFNLVLFHYLKKINVLLSLLILLFSMSIWIAKVRKTDGLIAVFWKYLQ